MIWWLLAGTTAITFVNRYAFFAQSLRYQPNKNVKTILSYSSYAVLTAIWTPIVFNFDPDQGALGHAGSSYLIASLLAAVLSFARIPSILVVITSIGTFFLIRYLV